MYKLNIHRQNAQKEHSTETVNLDIKYNPETFEIEKIVHDHQFLNFMYAVLLYDDEPLAFYDDRLHYLTRFNSKSS